MWQIFLLFYFVFGASSYLLRRVIAKRFPENNRLINATFFIFFLFPLGLVMSFFFPHNLNVGAVNLILLLGGSIIWPVFNITAYSANKHVDVGIYTVINNLSPVFTLAIALTFLDEKLTVAQCIGIFMLIFSGLIVALPQLISKNKADIEGILLCVLSTAILGVAVAYEKFMLGRVDFGTYLIFGWGAQIAWSVFLARRELHQLPKLARDKNTKNVLFWYGATNSLKSASFISALKISGSASIIGAATDFMSVVVVVSAYFILKETSHIVFKISGAILGIVGLIIITLK
ncbi:EamA family transporter [Candidatus Saccharibacteria bacterium]|nr:EamA family transporter [Candidatus Saccharibacteria bacterium]